jgi:hypothetical protein
MIAKLQVSNVSLPQMNKQESSKDEGVINKMQRVESILWRTLKVTPVIGYVFIIVSVPQILRRKGFVFGALAVTLDILPVICLIKAGIEIFTGDLLPDKMESASAPSFETAA